MKRSTPEPEENAILAAQLVELGMADAIADRSKPLYDQFAKAFHIQDHAREVIGSTLEDARLGQPVRLEPVRQSVEQIAEMLLINPDALLCFSMLKRRDDYTFLHSFNVGVLLIAFCQSLGMEEQTVMEAGIGGMLHDVGKMRLPESLLTIPGPLTKAQYAQVQRHVAFGRRNLERTPGIAEPTLRLVSEHHERQDGSGYPVGLKGEEISQLGKMAAIVDAYDAMTSITSYRRAQSPHHALSQLMALSGTQFDNTLFERFIKMVGIYPLGSLVKLRNGLLGVVTGSNSDSLLHPILNIVMNKHGNQPVKPYRINLIDLKHDKDYQRASEINKPPESHYL